MKPLKEALISKDKRKWASAYKELKFSELKFGDVVRVYENGNINIDYEDGSHVYMYLPKAACENILRNAGSFDDAIDDVFIMWVPQRTSYYNVVYWNATDFKVYFPFHQIYQSNCKIEYIIDHYDNYRSIKNAKELKAALNKYNK